MSDRDKNRVVSVSEASLRQLDAIAAFRQCSRAQALEWAIGAGLRSVTAVGVGRSPATEGEGDSA